MVWGGNTLTHYRYRYAEIRSHVVSDALEVEIRTPDAAADLHVVADLSSRPAPFPASSPFADASAARRFAGPLPWTFDFEAETGSIIMIRGRRSSWRPEPVAVEVEECTFLRDPRFGGAPAVLANAFYVSDVDYRWDRGVRVAS
jgi:hypothetical protein